MAPAKLEAFAAELFRRAGASDEVAAEVAAHLVDANRTGHDSHGVIRVGFYLDMIAAGELDPRAAPLVISRDRALGLVSGEWGFGQPAARAAVELALELATEHGVGLTGVVRCTHLGRIGAFAEQACKSRFALLAFAGGFGRGHNAVPFGGARGFFGANPLAAGFPTDGEPLLIDFATTRVAAGKVLMAAARGEELAPGLVVDKHGRPTTSPGDFLDGGALVPFGDHKGYGLAVLCELLGQVLTASDQVPEGRWGGSIFHHSGAVFVAVDVGAFRPADESIAAASSLADRLREVPPAPGFDRVLAPGDPEAANRTARADRLELPRATWDELAAAAGRLGANVPASPA